MLQSQANLAAHYIGLQQVAAGGTRVFAYGQQGREDRNCGMTETAEVVEVQCVAHGPVGQRRVCLSALEASSKHR